MPITYSLLPKTRPGAWRLLVGLVTVLGLLLSLSAVAVPDNKGVAVVRMQTGEELFRYGKSYALLIGVGDYRWRGGWADLNAIPKELDRVEQALKAVGFQKVVRVDDPDEDELRAAFEKFKDDYGFDENNRLLFFFAGHGHTTRDGAGYLVPRDAPNPDTKGEAAFLRKALPMTWILAWAREIKARHALFLFDSCFSGSVFRERTLPKEPPRITRLTARPVRQFITAGSANEPVPAKGVFAPAFADAIAHGKGDLNGDGYVTGMELGVHLEAEVSKYTRQTPQFGKIDEYRLSQGDFVFVLDKQGVAGEPRKVDRLGRSPPVATPTMGSSAEQDFWNSIEQSKDPDEYRAYLEQYPNGSFAPLARTRIRKFAEQPAGGVGVRPEGSPQPTARPVTPGQLVVRSNVSGDTVYLDDKAVGPTGPGAHELAPGEYTIRVEKEGFEPFEAKVTLAAGEEETVQARLAAKTFAPGQSFRDRLDDGSSGPEMVSIPGGCFQMGSPTSEKGRDGDERQHRVCVEGFALGKYEVTFAEYDRFARATGRKLPGDADWGRGRRPVIHVSWEDATAYAEWLSRESGKKYRLPTEAEWEYAARAGTKTAFSTGNCIHTDEINYDGNYDYAGCGAKTGVYRRKTVPVGSLPANPWGLHEVHGNVWEWSCSLYKNPYDGNEQRCVSKGVDGKRVVRGGGWLGIPWYLRSANRNRNSTGKANFVAGFRIARVF
uniref:Formylglycine-generating enzyme, required for sulfatase activity, contains SUMF1/FGE domain n=1 Tax=Candidatus Kentrum sp. FM TaxID=2126340 RepID=A0A450SL60_9GAMM|nr:MAG: Formylglycine-generating enzyme, required for sulfatase activity, contains SUMF1/FGE domain [Candidatus Kentron sp. FM]VFJ54353.1 MAG: Formylglycine-generating enzyme, required for sulfatase activity, contains SUMF1/FGE domain [Candidatus Kentron sp. FM]VFK10047.1 MAG: Formylglycine-generating enzyme, required for sulfatase activity, contains SUMF1/FGE domain [Candidatus Kentron sp. FM]